MNIKRNILLNPGPSTTTDTVKMAQVVPDICPREDEFAGMMKQMREDLVKVVHGDPKKYTAVLFCGSGTLNLDVCINSLLPEGKKILVVNNGAYSSRAVEICEYYGLDHIDLLFPIDEQPELSVIEKTLMENPDVAVVYTTHNETGTGVGNPIREIGAIAHAHNAIFVVDTTSTYAMVPIDIERDNIDFCMASAQKGLMSMTGLSFVVGNEEIIKKSKDYPKRSYYCNLFLQYDYFEKTGQMHFTPPVQTVYATRQALKEYFAEGEMAKWERHSRVMRAIHEGLKELGFRELIRPEIQIGLVASAVYPDDPNWDFKKVHDYCYDRGFTIYPGKLGNIDTFRIANMGDIKPEEMRRFTGILKEYMKSIGVC